MIHWQWSTCSCDWHFQADRSVCICTHACTSVIELSVRQLEHRHS